MLRRRAALGVIRRRFAGAEIDAWLGPYRRLWADRLDALEEHLDGKPR